MAGEASGEDWSTFVRVAYRGLLRREADEEALNAFVHQLSEEGAAPATVLSAIMASPEYVRRNAPYTLEEDERIAAHRTPSVLELSSRLERDRPYPKARFEEVWTQFFERELPADASDLREYAEEHKRRFWETVNAIEILVAHKPGWRMLDFGVCGLTPLYRRLFSEFELVTSDRPVAPDHLAYFQRISQAAGASAHFSNDLNDPRFLSDARREEMGSFDVIVFTEVIEHLVVHPVSLLSQVIRLLAPGGQLYITTPNVFSRHRLNEIERRINPQAVFPLDGNEGVHFHHREFCMSELLDFVREAGATVTGFYFSDCWESEEQARALADTPDQRSNMVVTARRDA